MVLHLNLNIVNTVFAADPTAKDIGGIGGIGLGPFGTLWEKLPIIGKMPDVSLSVQKLMIGNELNAIVSIFIGFLTTIAALWFIIRMIIGGISWLSAGGEQKSIQNAQQTITNAIIGLAIVVASYAIISVIGKLLGIEILNPAKMLGFPV